jgi:hypothetical protein
MWELSTYIVKQLYMWLLFVDSYEGLEKLQQQEQRALWPCDMVTLALQ